MEQLAFALARTRTSAVTDISASTLIWRALIACTMRVHASPMGEPGLSAHEKLSGRAIRVITAPHEREREREREGRQRERESEREKEREREERERSGIVYQGTVLGGACGPGQYAPSVMMALASVLMVRKETSASRTAKMPMDTCRL